MVTTAASRISQADRRARSRRALLEAAARGLSRYGYGNLVLEEVAADAGYTRGALYHLFSGKEDLALAVVRWVEEAWYEEVGHQIHADMDPLDALRSVARSHAVFCRRDVARVMMTLRVEFSDQDHPVGRTVKEVGTQLVDECARLIEKGREKGSIPPGPPPRLLALAYAGALEGVVINLAGKAPYDEQLADEVVTGLLLGPRRAPGLV